ncbi:MULTISPECIES: hypothetical protein [Cyanophyceae]|uniref:hypothetical protein n=1 Tax=Cyanophyceae TaxID=3028117 RepID=UPI001689A332|nr:hypothetical protein [Trichocoleus sp. FACHB-40]MBD2006326.1 hypothetical protein [Trichocoleus sp. FACHB-40]
MKKFPQHQILWQSMKELGTFNTERLQKDAQVGLATTVAYCRHLRNAGYLLLIGKDERFPIYKMVRDTGVYAPVIDVDGIFDPNIQGNLDPKARMWKAIRILKKFTLADLQGTAEVPSKVAWKYVNFLCRTGFLHLLNPDARRSASKRVYMLARNTGPISPTVCRLGKREQVLDFNTKTYYDVHLEVAANG